MSKFEALNIDELRSKSREDKTITTERFVVRNSNQKFIKGPVPAKWLAAALQLGKNAIAVGLAVWFANGLNRGKPFRLQGKHLETFGIGRYAYMRGLNKL